jgi:UDP-N-acetylmuramoyl-L-alanyl-D-glutamate--2,6-diaminopimelate ligase
VHASPCLISLSDLASLVQGTLDGAPGRIVDLSLVTTRSDHVTDGGVYIAIRGSAHDGHYFLPEAARRGAAVLIVSSALPIGGVPTIRVSDTRRAWSRLAALRWMHPTRTLRTFGVTGTNGKTTTVTAAVQILNGLGRKTASIGTLGFGGAEIKLPGTLTTPDPDTLHEWCAGALQHGFEAVVMEVSSHALHQHRVADLHYDGAAFTNLSRDHLDYHGTMEEYFAAKARLFDLLRESEKRSRGAVINVDDPAGQTLFETLRHDPSLTIIGFGTAPHAALRLRRADPVTGCTELELDAFGTILRGKLSLPGLHNVYNVMSALGLVHLAGGDLEESMELLASLSVPGRLERVEAADLDVFIDYAHTPDGLERVLLALRPLCTGELWVIFGCGGDRDPGKRPLMGTIASRHADRVVVTSDNPRTENPQKIIDEILGSGITPAHIEPHRADAIEWAITHARKGDTILVAGKGHEDYQIVGTTRLPFSDGVEVRRALGIRARTRRDTVS